MKSFHFYLVGLLFFTACGSAIVSPINYDGDVWETFEENGTTGLSIKEDISCWIDFAGELTKPGSDLVMEPQAGTNANFYFYTEGETVPSYVSFDVNGTTYFGNVSLENPEVCTGQLLDLAEMN